MRNYLKGGLTVVVVLIIITFAIKNNQAVQLHYYFNSLNVQLPAYALVFLSLFLGILLGLLIGWYRSLHLKKQVKRLKQDRFSDLAKTHQHEQQS